MRFFHKLDRRAIWLLIGGVASISLIAGLRAGETALDRYVARPDPSFSWKVVRKVEEKGQTEFVVDLKSQTWRSSNEVDRTVWQHWLSVTAPGKPVSKIAFLFIGGGANGGPPPLKSDGLFSDLTRLSGTVCAELSAVPNQPLVFHQDGVNRKEDDLICYTWDQFLKGGDDDWPARLPMVKSAVRAMDCIQELLASPQGGGHTIERFVIVGGSKRGWTTWCTAAVDKRVAAIVPASIDCLHFVPSLKHQLAVYGSYSPAIGDYVRHKIVDRLDDPRMMLLLQIEDPYSYRSRLTMPKFVVCASGDQYFCPDSSRFYFDDLPPEKYLRYVPNTDHSLRGSDARESIIAFYCMIVAGSERPAYSWTFDPDGSIRVTTNRTPEEVLLWQATNPAARDFRLAKIGRAFKSRPVKKAGDGRYAARVERPDRGWTAAFVELKFNLGGPFPLKVSTAVRIVPDTLPYEAGPASAKDSMAPIAE